MKVLLLFKPNMPIVNTQQTVTPNGLLYIGALLLSRGVDTEVLNLSNKSWGECKRIIEEKKPDIVGVSCYTFNRHTCIELATLIKGVGQRVMVVFGGPHSSIMYKQLLGGSNKIDAIVLNEGETTFLDIVQRAKEGKSFEDLIGIAYKKEGKIINNGFREALKDLDELPIPAQYFKYKRIITSRGCPGRCIFCDTPYLWGSNVRLRSANKVVDEIEMLNKRYGLSSFIFSDDTFTFDRNRTIDICREIVRRGLEITWDCRSRVNLICEERLRWMKKAGCIVVSYGIESGSQKILNNLKKGITLEQIKKAAFLTRRFGFELNYFIIVGSPGETDDTIRKTMKIIEETKPTSIFTYIMQLTPGTEIYKTAKEQGLVDDSSWVRREEETIFYDKEKDLKELARYACLINELSRLFRERASYSEEELREIMEDEKGVHDLVNLAQIKIKHKQLDEAEHILDEAIKLNPGSSEALMNKAVLLAMREDENCAGFFDRSIKADPENLLAYKNLGLFWYRKKEYGKAIKVFNRAIEIEPADVEFYNNLGSIYGMQDNYDEAIETFKKALLIDAGDKEALKNLGIILDKKSKKRAANETQNFK